MGVAGVAMFGVIFSFIMTFVSIAKYLKWKKIGTPAVGVIGAQKGAPGNRKTHFEYVFDFTINLPSGKIEKIYVKNVGKNQTCKIKKGDEIPILWNDAEGCYIEPAELKRDVIQYPIIFAGCLVTLVLCFFLSLFLQSLQYGW